VTQALSRLWEGLGGRIDESHAAVLSGATGANPATAEERDFFDGHRDLAVRATGSYLGHGLEAQFAMNLALATVALDRGSLFPPCDSTGLERPMNGELKQVIVTGVGHWRGEGLALVERAV
jgi:3-oxoacyl-[acyl-carrier-protein] synthase II